MAGDRSQHRLGIALVVAGAVAWSTAPFFTRLLPFNSWTILFWRGLFGGGLIAVVMVLMQGRAGLRDLTGIGKNGWLVASLSTLGMVVVHPGAAAHQRVERGDHHRDGTVRRRGASPGYGLARPRAGERMLASLVALCGVAIIVGNARAGSDITGSRSPA